MEFTLNVITQVGYGKQFGFLKCSGDLHQYHASCIRTAKAVMISTEHPIFQLLRPWLIVKPEKKTGVGGDLRYVSISRCSLSALLRRKKKMDDTDGLLRRVSHEIIRNRFSGKDSKSKDMLVSGALHTVTK